MEVLNYIKVMGKRGKTRQGHKTKTVLREEPKSFIWQFLKSLPGATLTAVGIYTLFSTFLSVTPGDILGEPQLTPLFLVPFTVTNSSTVFALYNVSTTCEVENVSFANPKTSFGHNELNNNAKSVIPILLSGNQDSVHCDAAKHLQLPFPVKSADLTMLTTYHLGVRIPRTDRVLGLPFTAKYNRARFITYQTPDHLLKWIPFGRFDDPSMFLGIGR